MFLGARSAGRVGDALTASALGSRCTIVIHFHGLRTGRVGKALTASGVPNGRGRILCFDFDLRARDLPRAKGGSGLMHVARLLGHRALNAR